MNKLKGLLFLLMTFGVLSVSAQDVIVRRDGDELQCKILEVSKNEVRYKRWTNQEGPAFTEKKSDIFMIKYENGEKDVMAYGTPSLEVQAPSADPSMSTVAPEELTIGDPTPQRSLFGKKMEKTEEFTIAEPTPISNEYLKYKAFGGKSGIIKWGYPQTPEQAQNILTKDWLDYKEARKDERAGKIMAFTGGTLFLGGLGWTVVHSVACKRYRNAKREYEEMDRQASEKYNWELNNWYNDLSTLRQSLRKAREEYKKAEEEYRLANRNLENSDLSGPEWNALYLKMHDAYENYERKVSEYNSLEWETENENDRYNNYIRNNPTYQNSEFFDNHKLYDMDYWAVQKNRSYLFPMIGGLATGTPLLIVGIIKAKRGHRNATQIVNKHIDEYEQTQGKTSMSKPEFDIDARGNNLIFSLKF
jgi:hypothetical protein